MSHETDITTSALQMLDAADAAVLAVLRNLHAELDPVPAGLTDDLKFALTVQALHAEVAELQLVGTDTGVRSLEYTRAETLTFSGGPFTTMINVVSSGPDEVRIDGWVTGGPATIELRERERTSTIDIGSEGRFVFERVRRGMVQFVLYPVAGDSGSKPVITPSIDL